MDAGWADWQSAGKGLSSGRGLRPRVVLRSAVKMAPAPRRDQPAAADAVARVVNEVTAQDSASRPTTSWRSRAARLQEDPRHPTRGSGPPPRWVVVIGVGLNVNNKLPKALGEAALAACSGTPTWSAPAPGDPATAEEVPGLPRGPNGHIEYPLPLRLPSREMKDLRGRAVLVTGAQRDRLGDRPPSPEGCRLAVRAPREQVRSLRAGAREGSESFELARRARPGPGGARSMKRAVWAARHRHQRRIPETP